jgi:hypothetical protein
MKHYDVQRQAWEDLASEDPAEALRRWNLVGDIHWQVRRYDNRDAEDGVFMRQALERSKRLGCYAGQAFPDEIQVPPRVYAQRKRSWETDGVEIVAWATLNMQWNPYDPFVEVIVYPSKEGTWLASEKGRVVQEIRSQGFHISIGHYSSLLPRLELLAEKFLKWEKPRALRLERGDFWFGHNATVVLERGEIHEDWYELYRLGDQGYKGCGLHFCMPLNEEPRDCEAEFEAWELSASDDDVEESYYHHDQSPSRRCDCGTSDDTGDTDGASFFASTEESAPGADARGSRPKSRKRWGSSGRARWQPK